MTDDVKPKRVKIADRLFKLGDVYYYRCGDEEKRLGEFASDAKAIKARDAHEALRQAVGPRAFQLKLKHAWPKYFEQRQKQMMGEVKGRKKIAGGTLKEIGSVWSNHLSRFFGNLHFGDIDDPTWKRYCDQATVADLKNHRKVLGGFLRWAKLEGYIKVLPEFEIPHVEVRSRPILAPDQIKALVRKASGQAELFVPMYLFMGIRRSEQLHLKWTDIDYGRRALRIRPETTRTRKGREVPIHEYVLELLKKRQADQLRKGIRTPYVYPRRGQPDKHMRADGIASAWRTTLKHAGLTGLVEPHDLRATFEYYANKRADFTDMQREKMAGASIKIQSQRYVTFNADDVRGLEESVQVEGLKDVLVGKLIGGESDKMDGKNTGKTQLVESYTSEQSHEQ